MSVDPAYRVDAGVLEELLHLLEVQATLFERTALDDGGRVHLPPRPCVSFHYALHGEGELRVAAHDPIPVHSGVLVVAPGNMAVTAQEAGKDGTLVILAVYVQTQVGALTDPFDSLVQPISMMVENPQVTAYQFGRAFSAWTAPYLGARAMIGAVLKQLIVEMFGGAYRSGEPWIHHLRIMKDPPIARAYALMLARPGAPHSVSTLADAANLSRSAFMARFSQALGCSPMLALRQARMQRAASLLAVSGASLEQVARSLGYKSTSSFARAFHSVLGKEPYDVRRALADTD
jgi:AraC family transcriptional regulator, activator of mtrCDE